MRTSLRGAVAVVTGASSGIGRATALELARRGADVALVARRRELLEELACECQAQAPGVRALAFQADMAEEGTVQTAAHAAIAAFGHVDVWVNDAAVLAAGTFLDTPPETFRRVVEVDFLGYVHAARAVLPHFVERGRGTIVNVASVDALMPLPYFSAYVASKHAVRGFTRSLRQELEDLGHTGIRICEVLPATIDTPIFQHAANYAGRKLRAMPPVFPPERVARAIVELIERPRARERIVGPDRLMRLMLACFPRRAERMLARAADREHLDGVPQPETPGNVFRPMAEGTAASGGWREHQRAQRRRRLVRAAVAVAALALPIAAGVALRNA